MQPARVRGETDMGEDIVYDGYVEVYSDGSCLAQLLDLPGCYARGTSEAEALAALADCIAGYYAWLSRHDDYTPEVHGPFRVTAAERVRVGAAQTSPSGAFFVPDAEPTTDEDLDWALALLDWAYGDLVDGLDATTTAGSQAAEAAQRIAHVVTVQQLWLLSRFGVQSDSARMEQPQGRSLDRLRYVWRACLTRLQASTEREREQVLDLDGERWSLRKILRRSILLVRMQSDELEG